MTDSEHSSVPERSGLVLIVDDDDPVRHMLCLALETAGFEVFEAGTQIELQRRLALTPPDALLLNLQRSAAERPASGPRCSPTCPARR
jgi:CheY-like chemotaxis protein